ncbi:MAG: basic secretory protein-like protein [Cyclobacteriaceae bacterium]
MGVLLISFSLYLYFSGNKHDLNTEGMTRYDTPNFSIFYESLKESTLTDIEKLLEETYVNINQVFDIDDSIKTKIIVCRNVNDFQRRSFGLVKSIKLDDWVVGVAIKDLAVVASPESPGSIYNYETLLGVLSHEYVHTYLWRLNPHINIWLNEGFAAYFSNQKQEITGDPPSFDDMSSNETNIFVKSNGYVYSYYYMEYLLNNYGRKEIIDLVKTGDYSKSLGASKKEIYTNWIEYLEKNQNKINDLNTRPRK